MSELQTIADWIKKSDGFTLVAHATPDGDTLGSSLALLCALRKLGKQAQVVCDQPVPAVFQYLPLSKCVVTNEEAVIYPNAIAIDCAARHRLGHGWSCFDAAERTANIDHHISNQNYAMMNHIDANAAATGEIIYRLLNLLEMPLDCEMAQCLFTALSTDTGHFSYSNTTPTTLRIAALLMETGIDIAAINRNIYRTIPKKQVLLKSHVLSGLETFADGKISLATVTWPEMEQFDATGEDAEGIVEALRDIDTVEVAIFIRQIPNRTFKVSLRSKQFLDVGKIAERFSGGGHVRAAGCSMEGSLSEIKETILEAVFTALQSA